MGLPVEWKTSIPVMPVVCSHRIFCLRAHTIDRDYRLPRAETHSSSEPVQHPIKAVVHPTATPSTVPSSPFTLQSDHQPKKSFDGHGASTLLKLPTPTSSVPAQRKERKESTSGEKSASHSRTTSTSSASGLHICTSSTHFGNSCLFCSPVTNTSITSGPKSA